MNSTTSAPATLSAPAQPTSTSALHHIQVVKRDGRPVRWNFTSITEDGYTWEGWVSDDEGSTWHLVEHNEAVRVP